MVYLNESFTLINSSLIAKVQTVSSDMTYTYDKNSISRIEKKVNT